MLGRHPDDGVADANAPATARGGGDPPSRAPPPPPPKTVPEFINPDEASMPSMLTEPEMRRNGMRHGAVATPTPPSALLQNQSFDRDLTACSRRLLIPPVGVAASCVPNVADASASAPYPVPDGTRGGGTNDAGTNSGEQTTTTATSRGGGGRTDATDTRGDNRSRGTYFGLATVAESSTAAMSSATRAGGIERLLGVFSCGDGAGAVLPGVLNCGGAIADAEKDEVTKLLEEEEELALEFQRVSYLLVVPHLPFDCVASPLAGSSSHLCVSLTCPFYFTYVCYFARLFLRQNIIKNGIKLIFHESPSRSSPNPDWIQSTVKLFLRPGNCHTESKSFAGPTLAWAVLPVVSRMQIGGTFDSGDEEAKWTKLGLLDVHSILMDEASGDDNDDSASRLMKAEAESVGLNTASVAPSSAAITGFFSVTAANGAVYVFEAPSARQRDYVVGGLRAAIARMTRRMVAGEADVIAEVFSSDDAGQLTGELPSLETPWKTLTRVTNAFVDQL